MHELKKLNNLSWITHEPLHNPCFLDYDDMMWVLNYKRWVYEYMHVLCEIDENDLRFLW